VRYLALATLLALAACANPERGAPYTTTPVPVEEAGGFTCSAEGVKYAIGQRTSIELGRKLLLESGAKTLGWIPPRTATTMEYRPDRLNVAYDDDMVITSINCG
jgi:Peptidase inhibitor I78 family